MAQWLINISLRMTPAFESLQTNTYILDSRKIFLFLFALISSIHCVRSVSFLWLMVCAELWAYSSFMMWAKPIWDSISCLPALSTLKTTTILSWGRSSKLITVCSGHGQGRSLLLLRYSAVSTSERRLCSCLFLLFPLYTCFHVILFEQIAHQTHLKSFWWSTR